MRTKIIIAFSLLALVMVASGCGLFRKKNRCTTCPTWSAVPVEIISENNLG